MKFATDEPNGKKEWLRPFGLGCPMKREGLLNELGGHLPPQHPQRAGYLSRAEAIFECLEMVYDVERTRRLPG